MQKNSRPRLGFLGHGFTNTRTRRPEQIDVGTLKIRFTTNGTNIPSPTVLVIQTWKGVEEGVSPIGEVLRACREAAAMRQEDLAVRMNMARSRVSQIESGHAPDVYISVAVRWALVTRQEEILADWVLEQLGLQDSTWRVTALLRQKCRELRAVLDQIGA